MAAELDYLTHLRADSARFRAVLAATDPDARVPSCPDWSAADLLYHLADVQAFWGTIVRDHIDDPEPLRDLERAEGYDAQLAQFDECATILGQALETTEDDVPVWTWFAGDQSVGFVRRRQAHEALIHRIDAELTADALTDVDPALATDGVAEVIEWMYSGVPAWAEHAVDGAVGELTTTDTGARWLVQLGRWSGHSPNTGKDYADEPSITVIESGEPTFGISGVARDLDAWLWNRPTLTEISLEGDTAAFVDTIRTGVQ